MICLTRQQFYASNCSSLSRWVRVESTSFGMGQDCPHGDLDSFIRVLCDLEGEFEGALWLRSPILDTGRHTQGGTVLRMYNIAYGSTHCTETLQSHRGNEVRRLINTMRGDVP